MPGISYWSTSPLSIVLKCSTALTVSWSTSLRFLSSLWGDCCPPPATVWFPWAVKQDRVQTTDLTIPCDIRCLSPPLARTGKWYSKMEPQSLTLGVWVPFSVDCPLDLDGICFKVCKKHTLLPCRTTLCIQKTNVGGIFFCRFTCRSSYTVKWKHTYLAHGQVM